MNLFLPLAQVEVWFPGLILLGMMIGFLTGMFGVGGGFLLTPLLKIVFGLPYPIAVGSSLLQIFLTGSLSSWKHWKQKHVDPVLGVMMALGALCGAEIGIRLMKLLDSGGAVLINNRSLPLLDLVLTGIYLVLMISIAVSVWKETSTDSAGDEIAATTLSQRLSNIKLPPLLSFSRSGISSMSLWIPILLSVGVGILTGLLGVGGGFVNLPLLIYVLGVPTIIAVGTSSFQILFAAGYGAYRHATQRHVDPIVVLFLTLGAFLGVQLGVSATRLFGGKKIRRYFALVVAAGIILVLYDLIKSLV